MKQSKTITALTAWESTAESHHDTACIVEGWELVTIELDDHVSKHLLGTIVSDYKHRWKAGDYVFTSPIQELCLDTGLVKTLNTVYCLSGDGEEVFPTLEEAYSMRITGQPLRMIRDIESLGIKFVGGINDD
ncbi:hypothetical protein HNO52_18135 [Billgrantia diversa]|uniref:DUF6957 family protein n=1 Tax=Halomonas sp. MCCC 1A13316 TaxID=2733487 RepID=UPI0018A4C6DE|nr:hypothetical protein [Halomonas sp. MCCC 1A13316]QOR40224.1 hypothetical protein HNO52_18135 [Halomonas sp. MCCC 1A13316]